MLGPRAIAAPALFARKSPEAEKWDRMNFEIGPSGAAKSTSEVRLKYESRKGFVMSGVFVHTVGDASQLDDVLKGEFLKGHREPRIAAGARVARKAQCRSAG